MAQKKLTRFKEILSRLTGFETSVFGVSWDPPQAEIARAREVLAYLEDRRVLYAPDEMEVPEHCVDSVLDIRRTLTRMIGQTGGTSELAAHLRAMRAACRKFLDTVESDGRRAVVFGSQRGHYASWVFLGALGEMRGIFGMHIAAIAAMHGLDIEEGLASLLPANDRES